MIDITYFWKVFTSMVASLGVVMTFWGLLKKIKENTAEAKEELRKKEKRQDALNTLADNINILYEYEQQSRDQELIKHGMLAILRSRVNRLCTVIKEQGFMTIDEKIDLEDLYSAYEALGGNSRTHELYEFTVKNFPVKHEG